MNTWEEELWKLTPEEGIGFKLGVKWALEQVGKCETCKKGPLHIDFCRGPNCNCWMPKEELK